MSSFVKEMPPPQSLSGKKPQQPLSAEMNSAETEEAVKDLLADEQESALAKAVLEQSRALTQLVSQIASGSGDPLVEMGASSSTVSSKGALGPAKLLQELAVSISQGDFLHGSSADLAPAQLLDKGVYASRCLERFGATENSRSRATSFGKLLW